MYSCLLVNAYEGETAIVCWFMSMCYFIAGVYCEWKPTMQSIVAAQNGAVAACFEEYKMDLQLKCNDDNRNYTDFLFTPGSDTPETIFYQVNLLRTMMGYFFVDSCRIHVLP